MSPVFLFSQAEVRSLVDLAQTTISGVFLLAAIAAGLGILAWLTVRYIPHNYVGVVEKFWSRSPARRNRIVTTTA